MLVIIYRAAHSVAHLIQRVSHGDGKAQAVGGARRGPEEELPQPRDATVHLNIYSVSHSRVCRWFSAFGLGPPCCGDPTTHHIRLTRRLRSHCSIVREAFPPDLWPAFRVQRPDQAGSRQALWQRAYGPSSGKLSRSRRQQIRPPVLSPAQTPRLPAGSPPSPTWAVGHRRGLGTPAARPGWGSLPSGLTCMMAGQASATTSCKRAWCRDRGPKDVSDRSVRFWQLNCHPAARRLPVQTSRQRASKPGHRVLRLGVSRSVPVHTGSTR